MLQVLIKGQKNQKDIDISVMSQMLIKGQEDLSSTCTQLNKSPQQQQVKPVQHGRHVINEDDVMIHRELGHGEFGTVNHGIWKNDGSKVRTTAGLL